MIRVLLVEDEELIREGLKVTTPWQEWGMEVVGEAADGEDGARKILELRPDIVITDVKMPKMNGLEMIEQIRGQTACEYIILSGYDEFALVKQAIHLEVKEYLLKPVDDGKLCPVLDRAVSNLSYRLRSIWVVCGEGSVKVALSDIIYVEAENVYVAVHTRAEKYRMRMALGKLAEQLDETFFKVHRSFIVNLNHVQGISRGEVTMVNGDKIPLSRGMYGEVHAALIRCL